MTFIDFNGQRRPWVREAWLARLLQVAFVVAVFGGCACGQGSSADDAGCVCDEGFFCCLGQCLPLGSRCGGSLPADAGPDLHEDAGGEADAGKGKADAGKGNTDGGHVGCTRHVGVECRAGKIWWVDSCGNAETVAASCPAGCVGTVCQATVGDHCDPNFFASYCDANALVHCVGGRVVRDQPCSGTMACRVRCPIFGLECDLFSLKGECVAAGDPCDPSVDRVRCAGANIERCSVDYGRWYSETCPAGKECRLLGETALCLDPGADPCLYFVPVCADASRLRICSSNQVRVISCTEQHTSWDKCFSYNGRGVCGPSSAAPCDPSTYVPQCVGSSAVSCVGWVYEVTCPSQKVCRLSTAQGQAWASCASPDALECDPLTYHPWCDGKITVNCGGYGLTQRWDCHTFRCQVLGSQAVCTP